MTRSVVLVTIMAVAAPAASPRAHSVTRVGGHDAAYALRPQAQAPPPVLPSNATALEGIPTVKVETSAERTDRRELDPRAHRDDLRIRIADGRYYWASRGDRPLTLTESGEFVYLSSSEPGQYIRLRRINDRLTYVEHLEMGGTTVSYWGELRIVLGR
jgi:hypothetical protein